MACKFCDLKTVIERTTSCGSYVVGDWHFDKADDLTHRAFGRISLRYDREDNEWAIMVLVDEGNMEHGHLPSCAQFHPKVCPFCGRKLVPPKWLWRLESKDPDNGLWYNSDGEFVLGVKGCSTESLPMEYDWRYQQGGKSWWSSCSRVEDMTHWYSMEDALSLIERGFVFTRYYATEYHEYESETVFLKESCLSRKELSVDEVRDLFDGS